MPFKNPHPLYQVWQGMLGRCRNPYYAQWDDYGGRGITVCDRWAQSFQAFVDDMGPRPEGHTLDRRDNDLGYSKENCRWSTRKEQQRNRRNAVYVEIEGQPYRLMDLAAESGLKRDTIAMRAKKGLSYAQVMSAERWVGRMPPRTIRPKKTHCPQGHEYTAENTIINKISGGRACRICHNERQRGTYSPEQRAAKHRRKSATRLMK